MTTILLGRICRTCLKKSSIMHKLQDFIKDDLQIEEMLNQSIPNFDLEMDDIPLPVEICDDCLNKLRISYEFIQICAESNKKLRNILNQQEQEIENTIAAGSHSQDLYILEETDMLMNNLKKEFQDEDDSNSIKSVEAVLQRLSSPDYQLEAVKLEVELQNDKDNDDHNVSSSEEYWPKGDKEDSPENFFENLAKGSIDIKQKRKYRRKLPLKSLTTNKMCPQCKKVFSKRSILTRHLSVHSLENEFVCDICEYRFRTEKQLKIHKTCKHIGLEITLAGGPYPCSDCSMVFQQTRALAAHRVMHLERDFKCQVCGINLKTIAAVTRHMNCKHPNILPYKCHICDKGFPVENHLNDHINEHMGHKKYKCNMCEKSFPNSTALKDHMRTHTGEAPFLCPQCGKSFKTSNVLRQHLQRHGEKNFHCPECPMKFYVKVNLTKHMTSHTKLKPHVCEICGSAFTRQDSLKAHKFKHTGERPFKCDDCNMSFVFKRHLKRHKITHTGEKPHMCSFCDRAYAASGDLVKHLRTHVGEKTYFCDECPESFKYSLDLKDHKIQHYKEKQLLKQNIAINNQTTESQTQQDETITDISIEHEYEIDKKDF